MEVFILICIVYTLSILGILVCEYLIGYLIGESETWYDIDGFVGFVNEMTYTLWLVPIVNTLLLIANIIFLLTYGTIKVLRLDKFWDKIRKIKLR